MRMHWFFLLFLVATGCMDTASDDTGGSLVDIDGDGYTAEDGDCDDNDDPYDSGLRDAEEQWLHRCERGWAPRLRH